jgi:DNA-binding transcriptional LysR family regulator
MELRHLRYFVAVAEELHFRRAAERLHVAQPAVSEQVRKLEQELGVRLFDRTQRSVSLTNAGAALLEEARHVLRHAEVATQAARSAGDRATMRLRIGYLADSLPGSVPRALRQLAVSTPSVQVDLETGPALRLIEELRARRLDAVVGALPAPTNGLRVTPLCHQHALAVLPATDRHAVDDAVALDLLAPERLVVLPREVNPAFHNAVVGICRDAGLAPTLVTIPEPRIEHVLLSVAAGAGMALVPDSVAERCTIPGVRLVALQGVGVAFQSVVLTHPDSEDIATMSFLRAVSRTSRGGAVDDTRPLGVAA